LQRWRIYGPANPLSGPKELHAKLVGYIRPPGLWFRRFEGISMAMGVKNTAMRWHRKNPFDLVLGVSMFPDAEAAVILGKKLNLPVASLAVGSDIMVYTRQLPLLWRRLGNMLEEVDLPIGVSESICRKMAETGKCKRKPLCVYLGRDSERFSPPEDKSKVRQNLGWAEGDIVAIYVGVVADFKGVNELVAVAEGLFEKYHNFRLVCVGAGPAMEKLVQLRARADRDGAVVLPGLLSPEEVPKYLQASDFMVFPSYSEGMPQSVLEAMNCGLPVVATRVGGIPEAVVDGRTGILIDAKNIGQLQQAMEKMITDKEFRLSSGQNGLAYVRKVFDAEQNAEKLAKALWSLVA
jgi:glycosyltransferase involved in cell wall biosynthesis